MNVIELKPDAQLGWLVQAGKAESFSFLERLQRELSAGDFGKPETVLFGLMVPDLVGVGGLTTDPYPDAENSIGRLRHLYVLPHYRAGGVGRQLVERIIAEAQGHYRMLRLRTYTAGAARFYESLGFCACTELHATHRLELR